MKIPTPEDVEVRKEEKEKKEKFQTRLKAKICLAEILFRMGLGEKDIVVYFNANHGGDFYAGVVDYLREKLNSRGWKVDYEFRGFGSENARVDIKIRPNR
ncbi:MAG: hypothetical protein WC682_04770 [Parcubacteria group bacterium]|jgi:hypothetical protein